MNQSRKNIDSITAAQKHLQAASNLLLSTSPHASAFLASQLQQTKSPSSSHSNTVPDNCRACGNALVPGWSCTISKRRLPESSSKKNKTKSRVAKKSAIAQSTYVDYKCTLCNSVNTIKSDTQPPARRSKSKKSLPESKPNLAPPPVQTMTKPATATTSIPSPVPSTAVTSSSEQARGATDKKRNRKQKLGGLQAMLAKSKAPSTTPKGFDFMDFMKTT
ncbi:unnamed protein product [Aureobasidium vineae]|uniref:Uncharacterized protein n=1 Tax=Aureobasidium vineae TaxID=2773715 RepID=A0A9N8JFD1_9PEZI|nr:unnamed protein product [Aureobasidium vineae]